MDKDELLVNKINYYIMLLSKQHSPVLSILLVLNMYNQERCLLKFVVKVMSKICSKQKKYEMNYH